MDLFAAVADGRLAELRAALAAKPGAARVRNKDGASLLSYACYLGSSEARTIIRSAVTDVDPYEACILGDTDRIRAAIRDGWNPQEPAPDGFTPLGLAVFFRNSEVFDLLLPLTTDLDARAQNEQRVAAIHAAVAQNDALALEKLLRAGADPDLAQQAGFRPLHVASQHGHATNVGLLVLFGASVSATAADGRASVDFAREGGHAWLVEALSGFTGKPMASQSPTVA